MWENLRVPPRRGQGGPGRRSPRLKFDSPEGERTLQVISELFLKLLKPRVLQAYAKFPQSWDEGHPAGDRANAVCEGPRLKTYFLPFAAASVTR